MTVNKTVFIKEKRKEKKEHIHWLVLRKIYGRGGHLGNVTRIMLTNFHFLVPESSHTKFNSEWLSSF